VPPQTPTSPIRAILRRHGPGPTDTARWTGSRSTSPAGCATGSTASSSTTPPAGIPRPGAVVQGAADDVRVALLKPDYGATGGFERLSTDLRAGLAAAGVAVEVVSFDAVSRKDVVFGVPVPAGVRHHHHEYFQYLTNVERLDRLELDGYDVVVSSQPPTYLAPHDRIVAVFYHHARAFYDLADQVVASGIVDPAVHDAAVSEVRRIDRARLGGVRTWLAGSQEVADRLRTHWDVTEGVRAFRAAPQPVARRPGPYDPAGPAVCVSRHTWTKRTELVVQAAHLDGGLSFELVGGGDRLPWVRALDAHLQEHPGLAADDDPRQSWQNRGTPMLGRWRRHRPAGQGAPNLVIHGETGDAERDAAYDRAGVVVAPAHREDYGLTVLEAFVRGRPVIVCDDGGGLVELVGDSGAGVVVAPTAAAIAAAVRGLRAEPDRARAMADAAGQVPVPAPRDAVATLLDAIEHAAC
jgi:glycosyltransferase involved in cell wall biosynthesis